MANNPCGFCRIDKTPRFHGGFRAGHQLPCLRPTWVSPELQADVGLTTYRASPSEYGVASLWLDAARISIAQVARQVFDPAGEARSPLPTGSEGHLSLKCYGSTAVSKTAGRGSIPWSGAV